MKQIFLLTIIIFALSSFVKAQSFEIVNDLGENISGTTIIIPMSINGDATPHFKVKNVSAGQVSARISKSYMDGPVDGSGNNMCSPTTILTTTGSCVTSSQTPIFILTAGETSGEAHLSFDQGPNSGITTIQYKVFKEDNVSDYKVINYTYSTLTAVNNLSADLFSAYPNPASRNFTIQHNYGSQAVVEIFNVLGKSVAKISSNSGNQINIDCSKWENGYYFCRLYNNGKIEKTIKLVVTH